MITAGGVLDVGTFVIARVGEHPRRWRDRDGVVRAVREACVAATGEVPIGGTWLWTPHRATWLGPGVVVKVARVEYGEASLARDLRARRRIEDEPGTAGWGHTVAATRWVGDCAGHFTEVEERLPGRSLVQVAPPRDNLREAEEQLGEMHRTTQHPVLADDSRLLCWLLGPAANLGQVLCRWGRPDLAGAVARWAHLVAEDLRGNRCQVCLVHGDLWPGNVLVREGRVSGVVDWDQAGFHDAPLHDVLHFALLPAALAARADLGQLVREALTDNWGRGGWGDVFRRAAFTDSRREMGLSVRDALTWYWLRHAARMSLEPGHANNPRWVTRNLVTVASALKNGNRK